MNTVGAAVLAGGRSRRMGRDKALLSLGGAPFLDRILDELAEFQEKLLSVDQTGRYAGVSPEWRRVEDRKPGCGPLGGLCAVLEACASDALLVVTCDAPLYRAEMGRWLCGGLEEPWDAAVPAAPDGIHPLCAVYRKRCWPALERQLEAGDFRLQNALKGLNVRYLDAAERRGMLCNVNTPEEYRALLSRAGDPPERE